MDRWIIGMTDHAGSDLIEACWDMHIGRFEPSLPRADHAGEKNRQTRPPPSADHARQGLGKGPFRDLQNALATGNLLQDLTISTDQIGTAGTGSPIDANQRRGESMVGGGIQDWLAFGSRRLDQDR